MKVKIYKNSLAFSGTKAMGQPPNVTLKNL